MKIQELIEYLEKFNKSACSASSLGCSFDYIVRTETKSAEEMLFNSTLPISGTIRRISHSTPENIVEDHFKQISELIDERKGMVVYVRSMPLLQKDLDDDGEWTGHYQMRTRLQFGEPGKCITMEQYHNLSAMRHGA